MKTKTIKNENVAGMGQIRILFVLNSFGTGGSERVVLDICRGLDRSRFLPYVVSLFEGELTKEFTAAKIWNKCLHKRKGIDIGLMMRIGKIVREKKIDVINVHHFSPFIHTCFGVGLRANRLIYTDHTVREIKSISRIWALVARTMLRRCYGVLGISSAVASELKRKFHLPSEKVFMVPNAIDLERFEGKGDPRGLRGELGIPDDCKVVGIVGNLREQKDHDSLLRAFRGVLDSGMRARLLIIGGGVLRPQLEALRDDLGMQQDVHFLGARLDIVDLYRIMDVFCLSSRYEGLPLTVLEAMASGIPVVGTNVEGIREIIENKKTGLLVERSPESIAEGILYFLKNPDDARTVTHQALQYVHWRHAMGPWIHTHEQLFESIRQDRVHQWSNFKRRRVLVVIATLLTGGAEKCVLNLIRNLPQEEYAFEIVGFVDGPMEEQFLRQGCSVHKIQKRSGLDFSLVFKLFRIMRSNQIDIVNTHHFMPLFYTFFAAKVSRIPLVHVEHSKWEVAQLSPFWKRIFRYMVLRIDSLVLISQELHDFVLEVYGPSSNFRRIVNGISVNEFNVTVDRAEKRKELSIGQDEVVIGCVANLRREKNQEMLLRAFALLLRESKKYRLMLVGEGAWRQRLLSLAEELGLRDRVIFCGERSDVKELYRIFDIYCLTSLYEGLPLTILEAMASRVPVIGTDVMGIREVIEDGRTGYLVGLNSCEDLQRCICRAIDQTEEERNGMLELAHRKVVEHYNIERNAMEYHAVFQSNLSEK